jgi:hypothetical protein
MKTKPLILFSVLTVTLLLNHSKSIAATQLPYFGPDQKKCNVMQPEGELSRIDSGYVTSEDCSFVYVLPPSKGVIETLPATFTDDMSLDCHELSKISELIRKTDALDPNLDRYRMMYDLKFDTYTAKHKGDFSNVVASAGMEWNELIAAYKNANKNSFSEFRPMPIKFGVLSISKNVLDNLENRKNHFFVEVSSYKAPDRSVMNSTQAVDADFSYLSTSGSDFLMGQSVAMNIKFDFLLTCSILLNNQNPKVFNGTYTYVYPVQSKGLRRYKYDAEKIKETVKTFIELTNQNSFKVEDLVARLKSDSQIMSVELNEGAFPDTSDLEKVEFKNDLTTIGYTQIFNALAKQSAISLNTSTVEVADRHEERKCKLFGFIGCHTNVTYTYRKVVNWDQFKNDLIENLKIPEVLGSQYQTNYFTSTSSIIERK